MIDVTKSLIALRNYNPKESIYLKVVGQNLEAVRVSWFGRLLMWLGLSSACMTRVADFIEKHIDSFCLSGEFDFHDTQNPLRNLIARLMKYEDRHPTKISAQIQKIVSIYKKQSKSSQISCNRYHLIKNDVSEVKKHLQSNSSHVNDIVQNMSLDEVSTFANSPEDVFGIFEGSRFDPSKRLVYAIDAMSVSKIKKLISALPNLSNMIQLIDAYYNLSYLIHSLKTPSEQEILFQELVSLPCYRNIIFVDGKSHNTWDEKGKRSTLDVVLLEYYLRHLFKNRQQYSAASFIVELKTVLETQVDVYGSPNTQCILQNRQFLNKFTDKEQDLLAVCLIEYVIHYQEFKIFTDILLPDYNRSVILYERMASSYFTDFCMKMRDALPGSDAGYILYLGNISDPKKRYEKLVHFMKHNLPDLSGSALADQNTYRFFESELLINIGIVLCDLSDKWTKSPEILDYILSDHDLSTAVYNGMQKTNGS